MTTTQPVSPGLIGRRIRQIRRNVDMTQAHLAATANRIGGLRLYASSITRIENGQRRISGRELVYLAQALGVYPEELLPEEMES